MWKKEITDTLKQTGIVLSFLLLMPIIFGINQIRFSGESLSFSWYIDWGMSYLIPFLILYLAYNIFSQEDSDGALEYLNTLPLNNWKLLAIKILPRFVVLSSLVLIYESLFRSIQPNHSGLSTSVLLWGSLTFLHESSLLLIAMVSGFMLGLSDRKNPFLILAFAVPVLYIVLSRYYLPPSSFFRFFYYFWWKLFGHDRYNFILWFLSSAIQITLPAVIPVAVLIPLYKSWDAFSGKIRSQRILKRMAAPLTLIIALFTLNQLNVF